ncbi:SigE family RNA polymerase sigma factor [Actinoalloteichus hymeniacidonis]|uniref:RNA polymerase sigma-70 factor, sigma-E family n=1 Tax=Actinoalloteichus hymeniacidonis TaxID=340345 RepID=A0AAC9HN84_9PSEU|nr:SigE family RNA polymerase sigma factor [Actinoalloteichus hymeniacidonis]AOS62289.1 RNA polymerase sigma-70 factor, sigma-E family [Actinoalloteichus hymeniacidonis]MBB5909685.1 RNA polymerase sigma-70 factor (sigma-E family) [Actinoalloteichus hymeniacidonis]
MRRTEAEFEDFVRNRSTALLRTAYLLCGGDRGIAEDLLQEVLARMFVRWPRITISADAYARAALANTAANRWRRLSRRVSEVPLSERTDEDALAGAEQVVSDRDAMLRALRDLPPRMRAVIVLRYFEDLTDAETASALGCSVGTVKSQTSRGLARLRQIYAENDEQVAATAPLREAYP